MRDLSATGYDTALVCIKDGAQDVAVEARKAWRGVHVVEG